MDGRSPPLLLALALGGCTGTDDVLAPSPAQPIDAAQVQDFEALPTVGPVPLHGVVRAFNRFGASVASDPVTTFSVDGTPVEVAFDGFGYGAIEVLEPGRVQVTGGSAPAELHALAAGWPGVSLHPGWVAPPAGEPGSALAVTNGGVVASGDALWWVGPAAPSHRILLADGPVLGVVPGHVDVDGVLDLVAWSASTVFLLRGRAGGGFGWGGGFAAADLSPAGADVGDLSGDNLPDLAIAWVAPDGTGVLDVWEGDGLFGFTAAEPRNLTVRPVSLDVADNTDDELEQVTILQDDGTWVRFIRGAELQYMPIGPNTPAAIVLPRDARLAPSGDIDGDDADEIVVAAERVPGVPREMWFFDVKTDPQGCAEGDPEAQCQVQFLPFENEIGAHLAVDDGNGDHLDDVWLLHDDGNLYAVAYDPLQVEGQYRKLALGAYPFGPFDVEDADRDGSVDLFLAAGAYWRQWLGQAYADLETFWTPRPSDWVVVQDALVPLFAATDTDGRADTAEVIALAVENGQTLLKVYQYAEVDVAATTLGTVVVDDAGAAPTDLAVCGDDAYVAVGGEVLRVSFADPGSPSVAGRSGAAVTRVDCGAGPSGADVAVLEGGNARLLALPALSEVGSVAASGAVDLAIGDLGAGPEVATCATEGCTIVWWPYGAAGEAVFARGDADGITVVDRVGAETAIGGDGNLSVADVDGDGNLDLLALSPEDGIVTLHRSTGASIAIAEVFHSERPLVGSLGAADGDFDGWPDLWAVDAVGDLIHSRSPLAMAATTADTGATGVP